MQLLRNVLAVTLALLLPAESVFAVPYSAPVASSVFQIRLPASLGFVSESYSSGPVSPGTAPDMILIQDLHANRSVQFAISGILKKLKAQHLVPAQIAVEGASGPIDMASMQNVPDAALRQDASDYLVEQAEMSGAMHYAVTEGTGRLYGIETDEYYEANLEMFQRSYKGRTALRREIENIQAVLPRLMKDDKTRQNAAVLEKDVEAVGRLINNQVIPDELPRTLAQASQAVDHLKKALSSKASTPIIDPLTSSVNFYALALLRNEELFKNALTLHERDHQKTTVMVTGGFHTQALAQACKQHGLSYAVITPVVKKHDKVDEQLYVQRLMGHHLTPEQVRTGRDWASAMTLLMFKLRTQMLFEDAMDIARGLRYRSALKVAAISMTCATAISGCNLITGPSKTDDDTRSEVLIVPTPSASEGRVLMEEKDTTSGQLKDSRLFWTQAKGAWQFNTGDQLGLIFLASDEGMKFVGQALPNSTNPNQPNGLLTDNGQPYTIPTHTPHYIEIEKRVPVPEGMKNLLRVYTGDVYGMSTGNPNNDGPIVIKQFRIYYGPGGPHASIRNPADPLRSLIGIAMPTLEAAPIPYVVTGQEWLGDPKKDIPLVLRIPAQELWDKATMRFAVDVYDRGQPLNELDIHIQRGDKQDDLRVSARTGELTQGTNNTLAVGHPVVPSASPAHVTVLFELQIPPAGSGVDTVFEVTPTGKDPVKDHRKIIGYVSKMSKKLASSQTLPSLAFGVMLFALGMAALGLFSTPVYAAELGMGSGAMVSHGLTQAAVNTVNHAVVQSHAHSAMYNTLHSILPTLSLWKDKVSSPELFMAIPLVGAIAAYRQKKMLEALRRQAAVVWAA